MKNIKNLIGIYNTFKCKSLSKKKESLNDIIKGTKSVLTNKINFREYIKNYSKTTQKYTFKAPGISDYPIFKKQSCLLIPVKTKKISFYEELKTLNNNKDIEGFSPKRKKKILFFSPKESQYKNKLLINIKTVESKKRFPKIFNLYFRNKKKKEERYNTLFLDFFYKWNKDSEKINENSKIDFLPENDYSDCSKSKKNTKFIKNEKYSELRYDDNKIFDEDYSLYVEEKIDYIINNTIENVQHKLESNFNDVNSKEIKLKLESIKIQFKPISDINKINKTSINNFNDILETNKNKENSSKEIVLYVPLYYAFLFCYKNIEFFKRILLSSIKFSNNFESVFFDDKLISSSLNAMRKEEMPGMEIKKEFTFSSKKDLIGSASPKKYSLPFRKLVTKNYNTTFGSIKSPKNGNNGGFSNTFSSIKNNFIDNLINNNKFIKKEEVIHSNKNNNIININLLSENNRNFSDKTKIENKIIKNNYNEYIFLWETCSKTFVVSIQMPIIYFKYKTMKSEILAYCDKKLFLYIYKKNFVNWDFYILNYLFSIKAFRKIILNNYSIANKLILSDIFSKSMNREENSHTTNNFFSLKNKKKADNEGFILSENNKFDIFSERIIINRNKNKIYNILNENNESYLFFYTNNSYINCIIKFYSYLIEIDYEKLNPKLKWKYYLDFKQMKQLNEISKYESLDSFLPKIIKTDFQNGLLSMDFSLFDEFNIDILGYERKNIMKSNKNKSKTIGTNNTHINDDLNIDIQFPCIYVEKVKNDTDDIIHEEEEFLNTNIIFSKNKVDIDINLLQLINKYKIELWSKKILEIINKTDETLISSGSPIHNKGSFIKRKNQKINSDCPISKNEFSLTKKLLKTISFNAIPLTSKFH